MSHFLRRSCGAVLAYAVVSQGALADVTASDVWADWQAYFTQMGYTVNGEQSVSGAVTTISDMTLAMALPEEEGQFVIKVPEMTLGDNGDGTVSIGFPDSFPMSVTGNAEGEEFSADVVYALDGLDMVVSGTPDDMTYTYTANSMAVSLDRSQLMLVTPSTGQVRRERLNTL